MMKKKILHIKMSENNDNLESEMEEKFDTRIDMRWLLFSLASAIALSKFGRGGLCGYLFKSLSWLLIWTIIAQTYNVSNNNNRHMACAIASSILGWFIGTILIWRVRKINQTFFD